jgi:hypothetical protein
MYVLLGIIVSATSFILNRKNQSNGLTLFIFIGILFVIVGAVKLIINQPEKPRKTNHTPQHAQQASHARQVHPAGQTRPQQTIPTHHQGHSKQAGHHAATRAHEVTPNLDQVPSPFLNVSPHNKVEQALFQQEVQEVSHQTTLHHPEIISCRSCGRRQYKTRSTCFVCGNMV